LLLTCAWILQKGISRLLGSGEAPVVNVYSFAVIILAIGIDFYRYRALLTTARKYSSQALEADAVHFYSDILGSALVGLGLIGVAVGIHAADALAAIMVAIWVGLLAVRLGRKNIDILLDRAPEGYTDEIRSIAETTPGVLSSGNIRLRRSGARLFADLTINLDHTLPFEQAHLVAGELEKRLEQKYPGLDAVVHAEPAMVPNEALEVGVLNYIRSRSLQAHHLSLYQQEGFITAELHLEVAGNLTLREAHGLATELEEEIPRQFPAIASVQIHLEEIGILGSAGIPASDRQPEMIARIQEVCAQMNQGQSCHGINVSRAAGRYAATLHCLLPGDMTVSEGHRRTTQLEEELRRRLPELDHVLIHAEPLS
jgi:divalent metal cation (Fe/Co/Zn/Cd) transporter